MEKYFYISLFAPLISSIFAGLFSQSKKIELIGYISSILIAISMLCSINLFYYVYTSGEVLNIELFKWIDIGNLQIAFSFLLDQISAVMICVVSIVSTMVHFYSIYYMKEDKSFNRFFAYLSAFVFSMMVLVLADNFAVLFIGWEGVGLCSWLLIGFWYERQSASKAANEAFIMNRIGDMGILLALFMIYWNLGSLQYDIVFASISTLSDMTISIIAILLFIGAMGKSAQFPLHTWLANAMEGPTPVSALIHAATMVTAGVYLVIRASDIYVLAPQVSYFIACLGAFVAVFAALMALVNNDLKRIIAYSTLSQLGYMFVAAGLGAYWVALFHLATHAFFKSVLFLGAGNVMHAMHDELDIRKMGSLYGKMKKTAIIMIIASLALSGIFPLAGFFSKDKILEAAFNANSYFLWFILLFSAFLTAFYSFRLIMKVFFVKAQENSDHSNVHEASNIAILAMLPLVFLAIIAGWFEHFFKEFVSETLLSWEASNLSSVTIWILIILTSLVSVLAIVFAIKKYKNYEAKNYENNFLHKILINEYFIPYFYEKIICKAYHKLAVWVFKIIEIKIIDNTIDTIAHLIYNAGAKARVIQSGNLSTSLRLMALGLLLGLVLALVLAVL